MIIRECLTTDAAGIVAFSGVCSVSDQYWRHALGPCLFSLSCRWRLSHSHVICASNAIRLLVGLKPFGVREVNAPTPAPGLSHRVAQSMQYSHPAARE